MIDKFKIIMSINNKQTNKKHLHPFQVLMCKHNEITANIINEITANTITISMGTSANNPIIQF